MNIITGNDLEMNAKKILKRETYQLLVEKDIDDTTVAEILGKAEISRQTFYRYYTDKYALANDIYDDLFTKPVYEQKDTGAMQWEDLYRLQFQLYRKHLDFARHVFSSRIQGCTTEHEIHTILNFDRKWIRERGGNPDDPRIQFALEAKDISGTYAMRKWILTGMKESDEEMVERFRLILPANLVAYYS